MAGLKARQRVLSSGQHMRGHMPAKKTNAPLPISSHAPKEDTAKALKVKAGGLVIGGVLGRACIGSAISF